MAVTDQGGWLCGGPEPEPLCACVCPECAESFLDFCVRCRLRSCTLLGPQLGASPERLQRSSGRDSSLPPALCARTAHTFTYCMPCVCAAARHSTAVSQSAHWSVVTRSVSLCCVYTVTDCNSPQLFSCRSSLLFLVTTTL